MTAADVWIPRLLPGAPDPAFTDDGAFCAGVYDGMDEDAYHADPVPGGSLSASGAKLLLPPSCPALYHYRRDHPKAAQGRVRPGHSRSQARSRRGPAELPPRV